MAKNEITITGSISENGMVKGVFTGEYNEFIKKNRGQNLLMTLTLLPKDQTISQKVYFEKAVLPCLQEGFKETGDFMTLRETEDRIRTYCPATENIPVDHPLNRESLKELIDWSIRYCAENFNIIVPVPRGK